MNVPENTVVKFRGVAFEFGDVMLVVPPLSQRLLEKHAEKLDALTTPRTFTLKTGGVFLRDNLIEPVHDALLRNYPAITKSEVEDFISLDNWGKLVAALMGGGDVPKTRVGETLPAGPLRDSPIPTGTNSAPESRVALDGAGTTSATN